MVARPRPLIRHVIVTLTVASGLAAGGCEREPQGSVSTALASPGTDAAASDNRPLAPNGKPYEQTTVKVAGRTFKLDLALDEPTRIRGLGGREHIPEDGGMLFVFPWPQRLNFVMRDCPAPIDILFLNQEGRVLTTHAMVPEEPRKPGESELDYNYRLKQYPSRYPSQFAVELQGGMIGKLGVKPGDLVEFDTGGLKKRAK